MRGVLSRFINFSWNSIIGTLPSRTIRKFCARGYFSSIGLNTNLMKGVEVKSPRGIDIGKNCVINKNVLLDGRGRLEINNNVDIARGVLIWTMSHDVTSTDHRSYTKKTIIEDYCWLGANSQIMPGIHLKKGVIVGAGSIVTKDFPEYSIVGGVPAKLIGNRNKELSYTLMHFPIFE